MAFYTMEPKGLGVSPLITSTSVATSTVETKASTPTCPDKRIEDYTEADLEQCWRYCTEVLPTKDAFTQSLIGPICAGVRARMPESDMTEAERTRAGTSLETRRASYDAEYTALRAATEGLAAVEDHFRTLNTEGDEENDILMYDAPCTSESVRQYMFDKPRFQLAQARISQLLAFTPSRSNRSSWVGLMSRWLSVAHAATGVRPLWLAPKGIFECKGKSTTIFGPPPVQQYEADQFAKAADAGFSYLVSPMPNIFGLQAELSQYARKGMLRGEADSLAAGTSEQSRCLAHERVTVDGECTALIFCEPDHTKLRCTLPLGSIDWLRRAVMWRDEKHPIAIQDAVLSSSMTGGSNPYGDSKYKSVAVLPGALIVEQLKVWGRHIASTDFSTLVVGQAFEVYLDRLIWEVETVAAKNGVPPEELIGMSTAELRAFAEEAQRARMRAGADATGSVVQDVPIVGWVFAFLSWVMAEVLPMASNPWHPPLFTYRSLRDAECRVDVSEGGTTAMLDRLKFAGAKVGLEFYNPFNTPEEADRAAPPEYDVQDKPNPLWVVAAGVLAGAGGAFAFFG